MKDTIFAHTSVSESIYPPFINISLEDGKIVVTLRGNPTEVKGEMICGYPRDKGKPGRCTPGDGNCNNYCNSAPEKGPMQDAPKPNTFMKDGPTVTATFSAEEWAEAWKTQLK